MWITWVESVCAEQCTTATCVPRCAANSLDSSMFLPAPSGPTSTKGSLRLSHGLSMSSSLCTPGVRTMIDPAAPPSADAISSSYPTVVESSSE